MTDPITMIVNILHAPECPRRCVGDPEPVRARSARAKKIFGRSQAPQARISAAMVQRGCARTEDDVDPDEEAEMRRVEGGGGPHPTTSPDQR